MHKKVKSMILKSLFLAEYHKETKTVQVLPVTLFLFPKNNFIGIFTRLNYLSNFNFTPNVTRSL